MSDLVRLKACLHPSNQPCVRCNDCGRFSDDKIPVNERLQLIIDLCENNGSLDDIKKLAKGVVKHADHRRLPLL